MTQVPETYLDHAASAPLRPEAREAMVRALDAGPGNASSAHGAGRRLRRLLEEARESVAALVEARPAQVVFTSGTSESNRLGIRGLLAGLGESSARLVTTAGAHDGVRALAAALADRGTVVRTAVGDRSGHVAAAAVAEHAGGGPAVVAVELVQPVTGAVQPVAEVARALPEARVHVDAAQAVGRVRVSVDGLGAATLAFSAHKIGGPQGIGALVVRDDGAFRPPDGAGSQERGRRAGTESVALAAGFAAAARVADDERDGCARRYDDVLAPLRAMIAGDDGAELVTAPPSAPGVALVRFAGCRGDALLAALDALGFRVSTGTACASGARTPPHVLTAAGWTAAEAAECVRVSVGWTTSVGDVRRLVDALRVVVPRVRSALGDGEKKLSRSSGSSRG